MKSLWLIIELQRYLCIAINAEKKLPKENPFELRDLPHMDLQAIWGKKRVLCK